MNIAVAQSGGPTCAINASFVGVYEEAVKHAEIDTVFGSVNGIEGIINGNLIDLKKSPLSAEDLDMICQTPSTVLGSCRYKLPADENSDVYEKILNCFVKNDIGCFFYIGGNDSMDTVAKLSKYFSERGHNIRVIGVPKTIDNDLLYTDHTPGFGSAAKYVATSLREIVRDSEVYDLSSVTIVEIMGRHAGWLTASSCVLHSLGEAAPHLIYVPEAEFSMRKFLNDVNEARQKYQSVMIAVSEGMKISPEEFGSSAVSERTDAFGHQYLGGIGKILENITRNEFGCKVRSIELNVLQRCASHIASLTDLQESRAIGSAAVQHALNGESGKMMCFSRVSDKPYKVEITTADAHLIANSEKFLPKEWLNEEQNNITDAALDYFLPLIEGEPALKYENGLPCQYKFK